MTPKQLSQTIEQGHGATYHNDKFTVYEHSTYGRSSVLSGQPRRVWLDDFETLADAQSAYPDAEPMEGTTYAAPSVHHLSDESDG